MLLNLEWQIVTVSFEDIVKLNITPTQHMDHIFKVIFSFNSGATHKLNKCHFFNDKIDYVDHVIRLIRIQHAPHTTNAIR